MPVYPALERYDDVAAFFGTLADHTEPWRAPRNHRGCLLGSATWTADLEARTGCSTAPEMQRVLKACVIAHAVTGITVPVYKATRPMPLSYSSAICHDAISSPPAL